MRSLCDDMSSTATTERRCRAHLLPSGHRLFKDVLLDIFVERIVIADVTLVGHATVSMPEVLSERKKAGPIAERHETGKGLPTLMGRKCPSCTFVGRQP
jgi:hypothetical protein